MTAAWLVRWDTARERTPALLRGSEVGSLGPGSTGFVAFQGYLFDRSELSVARPASEASLVALAYERWQDAVFDKLRGGFAVAIWDLERGRLVIGRDAMGLEPCFYRWDGRVLLASPSLDAILGQPEVDGRFDRVVLAEYLQNSISHCQVHETFYQDIRRLPPAHAIAVAGGNLSLTRYWDPVPPGFAWATEDELSRFAPALATAVGRCLSVGADSLALSGGFDSVSVAAVAASELRGRAPLHAVSLRFSDASCDEAETQTQVARALGMPQLMRSVDECFDDDTFNGGVLALSRVSPNPVLSPWQPMYGRLLAAAADLGLSRLMVGTGGDEMFYVNLGHGADCLAALDLRGLWRFYRVCQRTSYHSAAHVARVVLWDGAVKAALKQAARGILDRTSPRTRDWILQRRRSRARPIWLARTDADLIAALDRRQLESPPVELGPGEGAYVAAMRRLPQSPMFSMELDQGGAWASHAGYRLLFPYLDRDLVELSLRMPPEHLISGGRAKTPLRRLVAERLPSVAMRARKVSFARMFDALFRPHGRRAWRALGGAVALGELGIVDPRGVDVLMEDYFGGADAHGFKAWLVLSTELWLRARSRRPVDTRAQEAPE